MATPKSGLNNDGTVVTDSLFDAGTGTGAGQIEFDGSSLPAVNLLKKQIEDYARLKLGDGLVDVELDKEHYDLAIANSLTKFRQRSSAATEQSHAFLKLLPETSEYILPSEIMTVNAVYRRGIGSVTGNTATQFEPFSAGYMNTYMLVAGRVGGLLSYELYAQYQELAMTMFGGYIQFNWNNSNKKLTIIRKIPQGSDEVVGLLVNNYKPDLFIIDLDLKLKKNLSINNLVKKRKTFLITTMKKNANINFFKKKGFKFLFIKSLNSRKDFNLLFQRLYKLGYYRIFFETGLTFLNSLFNYKLLNNLYVLQNNISIKTNGFNNSSSKYLKKIKLNKKIIINLNSDNLYKKNF